MLVITSFHVYYVIVTISAKSRVKDTLRNNVWYL